MCGTCVYTSITCYVNLQNNYNSVPLIQLNSIKPYVNFNIRNLG